MVKLFLKMVKNNDTIYFFDDMVENLLAAERIGWKTVWISPDLCKKTTFY